VKALHVRPRYFGFSYVGGIRISRWKKIRHRLELFGVKALVWLPRMLPLKLTVKLVGVLGILAFDLFRIRRRVSLENLYRAFGDTLDEAERIRIARRSYVNFAKSMAEFASFGKMKRQGIDRIVRVTGQENLEEAVSRGNGCLAISGHFGNWEMWGISADKCGRPVDFLVGEQTNGFVDEVMNGMRRAGGVGIISKGIAARGVFESLKKNRVVAFLSDQNARKAGVFVDFFKIPASTPQGAAQFSYRMDSPIVFGYIVRQKDESHISHYLPPIYPNLDAGKDEEVVRITAAYTRLLEECITKHPDHYFWAHRRWKTRPPGEANGAINEANADPPEPSG